MTSTYGPGAAMRQRIVDFLRADGELCTVPDGLLFPTYAPQIEADDVRIYEASVQFPPGSAMVQQLPRVLIECFAKANMDEQDPVSILSAPVRVITRTLVAKEDADLGDRIDAYIASLLLSTWLTDARIIAAKLSEDGDQSRRRLDVFNGAWEIIHGYSAPRVGSLV